jgi:cytochrome P450
MFMKSQKGSEVAKVDFLNHEFIQNPFPVYNEIREKEPVHQFILPNGQFAWIVTTFQEASEVLSNSHFITSYPKESESSSSDLPPHQEIISRNLLSVNPTDHRRLRRLIQKAFTPKMVEELRERVEEIAHELLDKVEHKGQMDLIEDFAFPLPIIVICEMLGVPIKDQEKFREWSDVIMEGANNPQLTEQSEEVMIAFIEYLKDLIAKRRKSLQKDLISDLLRVEEDGDVLSEHELYALVFVLIIAGHETTVNLIGNGVLALFEHPEQMEKLKSQPELIHKAIEEILRYNGPAEVSNIRFATEDVKIGGKQIKKGEMIFIALSSANRDHQQFIEPDAFDITREANNHLAFGKGVHFCLGAPLARLEGEIAINILLSRLPNLQLGTDLDLLEWRTGMIIRGLKDLPVKF